MPNRIKIKSSLRVPSVVTRVFGELFPLSKVLSEIRTIALGRNISWNKTGDPVDREDDAESSGCSRILGRLSIGYNQAPMARFKEL